MSAVQARFGRYDEIAPPNFEKLSKPMKTKIYLQSMPGLKNTCIAWSENGPMVKEAEEVKL